MRVKPFKMRCSCIWLCLEIVRYDKNVAFNGASKRRHRKKKKKFLSTVSTGSKNTHGGWYRERNHAVQFVFVLSQAFPSIGIFSKGSSGSCLCACLWVCLLCLSRDLRYLAYLCASLSYLPVLSHFPCLAVSVPVCTCLSNFLYLPFSLPVSDLSCILCLLSVSRSVSTCLSQSLYLPVSQSLSTCMSHFLCLPTCLSTCFSGVV